MPSAVAKLMPSRASVHWREGYDQNKVEYEVLNKLQSFVTAPNVLFYAQKVPFLNAFGCVDFLNVLIVTKLGEDFQVAASRLAPLAYIEAYESALWAPPLQHGSRVCGWEARFTLRLRIKRCRL